MRTKLALAAALISTTTLSCGKGGGGGGWLVGSDGLMVNINAKGDMGAGYDLGDSQAAGEELNGIACRYQAEAWVVGNNGTLLYTSDAGKTWKTQDLGTVANLRSIATQDDGPVFVVGDGVFFTATPQYTTGKAEWQQLGDGVTSFLSVTAAQQATTVLAVSADGGIWGYDQGQLAKHFTIEGLKAIDVSPDGQTAFAVGNGLFRSLDAGKTWTALSVDPSFAYSAVSIDENGEAVAVGDGGVVSRVDLEGRVLTQRLGTADLKAIHIAPSDDYTGRGYAAGVGGQIWITDDSGWTWTKGPNAGRTVLSVDEIGPGHN
jgi:photosystem II stability/assembly factor-like uncharacterized protein